MPINDKDIKKLRQCNFIANNGAVLRKVNMLRIHFVKASGVYAVLREDEDMIEADFLDSLNFLTVAGYVELRDISSKQSASLADFDYKRLEAKVTEKGMRLAAGEIKDNLIGV